jgi:putative tricarboxylic transport membrane protein
MRNLIRTLASAASIAALASASVLPAAAQDYPDGPVSIVVGFAPGGSDDTGARALAPVLEQELGVPVIVDSRPGAAMQVALEYTWAKPHDGQTLIWLNQQYLSAIEALNPDVPYSTDQWTWLEMLQNDPVVVVVNADSPWQDMNAFVEDMRARPDEITVGLLIGSVQLLACKRLFEDLLGATFREVPQTSGGAMRSAVVGGHLDATCTNASETYALGPDVRALTVFNDNGSTLLPDAVPVNEYLKSQDIAETVPNLGSVRGVAVPKDFAEENPEAFQKLYDAYKAAVSSPEYLEWTKTSGRDAITLSLPMDESNQLVATFNQFFENNAHFLTGE